MKNLKVAALVLALVTLGAQVAGAQSIYSPYAYAGTNTASCVTISQNLALGSRGAAVSTLQVFLVSQNFPGSGSWMVTGYFGNATRAAVVAFQQQKGISATGIVDNATRAAIYNASCNVSAPYVYGSTTIAPTTWNAYNGYNYNNGGYTNGINLNLTSLSRNTGGSGDVVTIYGTGFDSYNNVVYIGTRAVNAVSSNGTSLTFTIPSYVSAGMQNLYVANSRGTSNTLSFTITSYSYGCGSYNPSIYGTTGYNGNCCNTYNPYPYSQYPYTNVGYQNCVNNYTNNTSAPTISYLSPSNGAVGTAVTVFGSGFSATNNTVHFGNAIITNLYSPDGQSVSFTVPAQLNGYGTQQVGLGSYSVTVTNSQGYTSNDASFTVTSTIGNTNNTLAISYLSPVSGSVGTVVTIYGTGFTSDSTVHFGSGVVANPIISNIIGIACTNNPNCHSGVTQSITFTVPSYIAPYCAANMACPMYVQMVTPGSYSVSVVNINGTSNGVTFQVQ